ncbi:MAG: TMEM14 family protein [bacterium]|nr:TMEM14 family protein [bacterium]
MIQTAQVVLGIYGMLLIVGGVMGMVKAGSLVSMIAGGISGVVALVGLWISLSDPATGFLVGALLALLLTGMFVNRFMATRKFMPAGMVLIMSLAVGILLLLARQQAVGAEAQKSEVNTSAKTP